MTLVAQHTQPCRLRPVLCHAYLGQKETADARRPRSAAGRDVTAPALRGPRGFSLGGHRLASLFRMGHQSRNSLRQGKFARFFLEKIRFDPSLKARLPLGSGACGSHSLFKSGFGPAVYTPTI